MSKRTLGYAGESLASEYITRKGFLVIKKNFTIRGGEIDLIARKDNLFVFIEVKLRSGDAFGSGEESVTQTKQKHIIRAITRFLALTKNEDADWRFDVIEIDLNPRTNGVQSIYHIEDIEL